MVCIGESGRCLEFWCRFRFDCWNGSLFIELELLVVYFFISRVPSARIEYRGKVSFRFDSRTSAGSRLTYNIYDEIDLQQMQNLSYDSAWLVFLQDGLMGSLRLYFSKNDDSCIPPS